MRKQAVAFAQVLAIANFRATEGWLRRCKERNGIKFRTELTEDNGNDHPRPVGVKRRFMNHANAKKAQAVKAKALRYQKNSTSRFHPSKYRPPSRSATTRQDWNVELDAPGAAVQASDQMMSTIAHHRTADLVNESQFDLARLAGQFDSGKFFISCYSGLRL